MGQIGCPETSATNYRSTLRKITEGSDGFPVSHYSRKVCNLCGLFFLRGGAEGGIKEFARVT